MVSQLTTVLRLYLIWGLTRRLSRSCRSTSKITCCNKDGNTTLEYGQLLHLQRHWCRGFSSAFRCVWPRKNSTSTPTTSLSIWPTTLCKRTTRNGWTSVCWTRRNSAILSCPAHLKRSGRNCCCPSTPSSAWLRSRATTRSRGGWTPSSSSVGTSWLMPTAKHNWSSATAGQTSVPPPLSLKILLNACLKTSLSCSVIIVKKMSMEMIIWSGLAGFISLSIIVFKEIFWNIWIQM